MSSLLLTVELAAALYATMIIWETGTSATALPASRDSVLVWYCTSLRRANQQRRNDRRSVHSARVSAGPATPAVPEVPERASHYLSATSARQPPVRIAPYARKGRNAASALPDRLRRR